MLYLRFSNWFNVWLHRTRPFFFFFLLVSYTRWVLNPQPHSPPCSYKRRKWHHAMLTRSLVGFKTRPTMLRSKLCMRGEKRVFLLPSLVACLILIRRSFILCDFYFFEIFTHNSGEKKLIFLKLNWCATLEHRFIIILTSMHYMFTVPINFEAFNDSKSGPFYKPNAKKMKMFLLISYQKEIKTFSKLEVPASNSQWCQN